jgi:hypothetical protein
MVSRPLFTKNIMNKATKLLIRAVLISLIPGCCDQFVRPAAAQHHPAASSVVGTWKGESTCVGNRPACKNEVVVYRFEAVAGKSDVVLMLADKILDGERVPMGKLEFRYDEAKRELSCEFIRGQTHGLWQFTVSGESMEGTLVLLPDRELGRRVKVKRVAERDVPAAPAKEMYDGM